MTWRMKLYEDSEVSWIWSSTQTQVPVRGWQQWYNKFDTKQRMTGAEYIDWISMRMRDRYGERRG